MSTNTQVETVSTGADKAKLAGAAVLLVGAVAVFYLLAKQDRRRVNIVGQGRRCREDGDGE